MTEINFTLKTEYANPLILSSKVNFLQEELRQQQDRITDLDEMLRFNKGALKIALNLNSEGGGVLPNLSKNDSKNDSANNSKNDLRFSQMEEALKTIISHLDRENSILLRAIEKLTKERNLAQSKSLISDQIAEEAEKHQWESLGEFEKKVGDLGKLVADKERRICELEKIKPIVDRDGVIILYREILSPSEQILKLHNENEILKNVLMKVNKDLTKIQNEKTELLSINFSLVNEINKLRVTLVSPLNSLKQTETPQDGNQSAFLINFHKKFLEESSSDSNELSPNNSPLPDKVQKTKNFDTESKNNNHNANGKYGLRVPKLDLTQAKKIQEINAKKSTQQAMPKADAKVYEKYQNLELELEKTKKLLQKEMCNNKLLIEENELLRKNNIHLISSNETFSQSQIQYEEKWKKVYHALEFYKDFYYKYVDLTLSSLTTKNLDYSKPSENASLRLEALEKYKEKHLNFEGLLKDPAKLIVDKKRKDEEAGKLVNVSILDLKEENLKEERRFMGANMFNADPKKYKEYLLNMARDYYISLPKKSDLKNLSFIPTMKLKRSLSNPIEYITTPQKEEMFIENDKILREAHEEAKNFQDEEEMIFETNYEEEK